MKTKDHFFKAVCTLAIPVALQSMLQSSFSMVDQIMIGQLGEINVAGVGLAGKFASIYSVVISAIGAVAGIMIAQYLGQKNRSEVRRSFFTNLLLGAGIAGMFMVICTLFPNQIMGAYTRDVQTRQAAAEYLMLISGTFVPMAGATLLSTLFRCLEKPRLPLYASILSALLNTGLNYIMIFGKLGISPMGVHGAAFATVISQCANFLLMLLMLSKNGFLLKSNEREPTATLRMNWGQYWSMLLPLLVCEVVWSLGENVYAAIYGHMSTDASAAMTLTNPIQGLVIGALCGLSQAASVIIGKHLGSGENEEAYWSAKKRGRTKYVMFIDMVGTWCFGVPLGLLSAFVWKLSIPYVYFLLSLEECIRFGISLIVFRRRKWMNQLEAS